MALPASEAFTTANDPLSGSSSWTELNVVADSGMAASSQYQDGSGNSNDKAAFWDDDTFADGQYAQIEIAGTISGNDRVGLVLRAQAGTNVATLARFRGDGNFEFFVWNSGGSRVQIDSTYTPSATVGTGDTIRIEIDDATDVVSLQIDYGSGFVAETTFAGSTGNASGSAGLYIVSPSNGMAGDNWEGGDLATGGGAFTLTTDSGSYAYTGTASSLLLDALLGADSGSYSYTGTALDLTPGYNISTDSGIYSYTGTATGLTKGSLLTAELGAYTYSGAAAALTYTPIGNFTLATDSGSYSYTGTSSDLLKGSSVLADSGSYTYNGSVVALTFTPAGIFTLATDSGSYSYTGADISLAASLTLVTDSGSYTYTGSTVDLSTGFGLSLDSGAYAYSGADLAFSNTSVIYADNGAYTYTGTSLSLTVSGQIVIGVTMHIDVENKTMILNSVNRKMVI